jgi:hypothetical protein
MNNKLPARFRLVSFFKKSDDDDRITDLFRILRCKLTGQHFLCFLITCHKGEDRREHRASRFNAALLRTHDTVYIPIAEETYHELDKYSVNSDGVRAVLEIIASHLNKNSIVYVDALSYMNKRATVLRSMMGPVISSIARLGQRFIMRTHMLAECTSVSWLYTFTFYGVSTQYLSLRRGGRIICNQNHAIFAQQ